MSVAKRPTGWCNVCQPPRAVPTDSLGEHLLHEHGMTLEFETWPDGGIVFHHEDINPGDFDDTR